MSERLDHAVQQAVEWATEADACDADAIAFTEEASKHARDDAMFARSVSLSQSEVSEARRRLCVEHAKLWTELAKLLKRVDG